MFTIVAIIVLVVLSITGFLVVKMADVVTRQPPAADVVRYMAAGGIVVTVLAGAGILLILWAFVDAFTQPL